HRLAGNARGREPRAPARDAAHYFPPERAARAPDEGPGEGGGSRPLQRSAGSGIPGREGKDSIHPAAVHGRRERQGEGSVRALRPHDRQAARGDEVIATGGEFSIIWPALIAGLLVTATHVPLGVQVLARGIVFIDLAVAQIAGVGVIFADWIGFD